MAGDLYTAPDFASSALVTIDTQRDVLDGQPLEIPGTSAALPAIVRLIEGFRKASRPIVHVVRLYCADGSNVDLCRRRAVEEGAGILVPGSEGAEPAPGLLPDPTMRLDPEALLAGELQEVGPREVVLYKPRWGAFYETALEKHLRNEKVSTVVFCGCNFPNCPRTSVYEASERDFRVVVASDALSGLYARGERELDSIGVALMQSGEILDRIEAEIALSVGSQLRREPHATSAMPAARPSGSGTPR
jgi:nicotinamidase-related amidase